MSCILVLTSDLPYFPGKMGVDFFNLRHLARSHQVAVVAPCYDGFPAEGIANLERAVQAVYLWPRPVSPVPMLAPEDRMGRLPEWVLYLPSALRQQMLWHLLRIHRQPADAYERLAILANCAPYLLKALDDGPWQVVVLIQTSSAPWFDFLPELGAKLIYCHDVRADYLTRAIPESGSRPHPRRFIAAIRRQEQLACERADVAGFVSELDLSRARRIFRLPAASQVAPIPLDTGYFTSAPDGWKRDGRPIVLFTGHLAHPPNIDAIEYFLDAIWPLVRRSMPTAIFQVVGMMPDARVRTAVARAECAELHADVPDIRPFFWSASVFVVPMRFGGGVRQKIFEAWSMRVPTVSTPMGMEGIDAQSGKNCWLEADPAAFAARVVALLAGSADPLVVQSAKAQVERTNSIEAAAGKFEQMVSWAATLRRHRPYKLLFDLRWMEIGKSGGIEQLSYELVNAISRLDHRNEYRLFCPRSTYYEWDLPKGFRCRPVFSDPCELRAEGLRSLATNSLSDSLSLPRVLTPAMRSLHRLHEMDFELVHSIPSYTHPDLVAYPGILTVTDLQHLCYPQFFTPHEFTEREKLYRESIRRARHLIAISEFTRQDLHTRYGVPLDRITTIWIIPNRHIWTPLPESRCERLLADMGVTKPFLFFPAHCWLHKNHARLVETFALIQPYIANEFSLVFTGKPFPDDHPARQAIETHGLNTRVKHLGYRSPLEIHALLQACFLLVFPSLFEGFGMPVAEAIIAEKPVACSKLTSLPEIAGDAALTFDPCNIHDMGGRLLEIINDPQRRSTLIEAARRRKPLFSARLSAVKTLAVYQRVYEELYS